MNCPACQGETRVFKVERIAESEGGSIVRRRRRCQQCGLAFGSVEMTTDRAQELIPDDPQVVIRKAADYIASLAGGAS